MKLDVTSFRYITKEEFRVLLSVEMGMRNHEYVPSTLVESIAKLNRGGTYKVLQTLLRHKLVAHDGKKYDGFRLTYHGFDFLALRALVKRGTIVGCGRRLGVGKESDVHFCQAPNGDGMAIKLHRLGRISFRNVRQTRDYMKGRVGGSWMYMARLAAAKEFAYMKALDDEGFPVPKPIDHNRHCVVMSFVHATPLFQIRILERPRHILERLMRLLIRLARAGIIHGDYNEFNLMIDSEEGITLIDFPQIVTTAHFNAAEYFDRDVKSTCDFFRKRFMLDVDEYPIFEEVMAEIVKHGSGGAKLANITVEGMSKDDDSLLVAAHAPPAMGGEGEEEGEEGDEDDEGDDGGDGAEAEAGDVDLVGEEGKAALGDSDDEVAEDAAEEALNTRNPSRCRGPAEGAAEGEEEAGEERSDEEGEEEEGEVGKVTVTTGARKTRQRASAAGARKNLQKQTKESRAKPNNQKAKQARADKASIKEYLHG